MAPLISNGLYLRPFNDADATSFATAVRESVDTVGPWMSWCHADYSVEEAQAWFRICESNLASMQSVDLGIFTAEGVLCGGIGVNQINPQANMGNLGYWVRQSMQGRGIASRAVHAMANFAFTQLGLTRLEIVAAQDNAASRRTAQGVGALFECIARNRIIINGRPQAAAVYSLVPQFPYFP